jgi:membrane protein implicated in regulation of membrane protease activity
MTWESFYLVCFIVGFALSLFSFVGAAGHIHLPGLHFHGGHVHFGHIGHVGGHAHAMGRGGANGISPLNFASIMAFLAWFGGTGYLLERHSTILAVAALLLAILSGLVGGAIVFWFLARLAAHDGTLDPADYDMIGVLGHVSSRVRKGGVGEIVYTRDGARCCAPIRSDQGIEIPKGAEVVVTRYERGIAYVRRWEEMAGLEYSPETSDNTRNSGL